MRHRVRYLGLWTAAPYQDRTRAVKNRRREREEEGSGGRRGLSRTINMNEIKGV